MNIYNELERALINGTLPSKHNPDLSHQGKTIPVLIKIESFDFEDKKFRVDYLAKQVQMIDSLKYLSLKLKSINLKERQGHL